MFGLLKHNKLTEPDYNDFRQSYCGTCKTIGKLYGQKERFLLNNDVVFLSELLAEINNCEDDFKYIKVNTCFNLPKDKDTIPLFLKYTASINVLLAYYKVLDNIEDSKYKLNIWKTIKIVETLNFKKAKSYLIANGLDTDFIEKAIKQQFKREKDNKKVGLFKDTFQYYAELTGKITSEVFKKGALVINKSHVSETLYEIGKSYGELVYLIDAIEDYEKDIKNNTFNIFRYKSKDSIDVAAKEEVVQYIYSNLTRIQELIYLLPISETKKQLFVSRLSLSISKINTNSCSCSINKCKTQRLSIRERYEFAIKKAQNISLQRRSIIFKYSSLVFVTGFLIFLFIFFPNLIYAADDTPQKAGCCQSCCGSCENCCGNDCGCKGCQGCGCGKFGEGCDKINDDYAGKYDGCCIGKCGACFGICCGIPIILGAISLCSGCAGGAAEAGPTVIVKIFKKEDEGCC